MSTTDIIQELKTRFQIKNLTHLEADKEKEDRDIDFCALKILKAIESTREDSTEEETPAEKQE